jgi:hypothetical protein
MAIIDNRLSSLVIAANYLPPDDLEVFPLLQYESGGVDLNNASEGLFFQDWTCRWEASTGNVVVWNETTQNRTTLFNRAGITELDFTFDQNMEPFVTFVAGGTAEFYWYDTAIGQTVFTPLPANTLTPRCALDDKRTNQDSANDIILAYVNGGALKYLQQRDRYATEYVLQDPFVHPKYELPAVLKKIGMNKANRLQFLCDLANPLDWCGYKSEAN